MTMSRPAQAARFAPRGATSMPDGRRIICASSETLAGVMFIGGALMKETTKRLAGRL